VYRDILVDANELSMEPLHEYDLLLQASPVEGEREIVSGFTIRRKCERVSKLFHVFPYVSFDFIWRANSSLSL